MKWGFCITKTDLWVGILSIALLYGLSSCGDGKSASSASLSSNPSLDLVWDENTLSQYLKEGKDFNAMDKNGHLPLIVACELDDLNLVKALVEKGAAMNFQTEREVSPVHHAAFLARPKIVAYFISMGAMINENPAPSYRTPLMMAASSENINPEAIYQTMKILLDNGADPNITGYMGETVMSRLAQRVDTEERFFKLLQSKGDTNLVAKTAGREDALLELARRGDARAVMDFINKNPVNINSTEIDGYGVLYQAISQTNAEWVEFLLKKGARSDIGEPDCIPLFLAVEIGNLEIVQLLIKYQADVNFFSMGQNPLSIAEEKGNAAVIQLLKDHGAKALE